ncbi:chemotaxis protein CheW [Rubinisphaera sp. JC750]|uniref:hybrid sensor histidine kinase/response regulator n=1 Tax=Rubinisphaera sp. JC750 TaxID=2898658 RepID=UPI001F016B2D|nr:chemotaxis protein CheW [Rubinisphaera sp. JC750]
MEDDIIQGFLEESWENLAQLDTDIVAFEKNTEDDELLASVFRTIHTIKGTCGFIGLARIGAVSHAAENVLGKMRDRSIARESDAISHVLEAVDAIKELLQGIESTGEEPAIEHPELIEALECIAEGKSPSADSSASAVSAETSPLAATPEIEAKPSDGSSVVDIDANLLQNESGDIDFDALDQAINEAAARHRAKVQQEQKTIKKAAPAGEANGAPAEAAGTQNPTGGAESEKKSVSDLSIRVNVGVLDRLMNLVGELVLARNQLMQLARGDEESKYAAPLTHLNRVTTDLQEGVMKTRMQPIGHAWNKLPRLVRDLSKVTGKDIDLEMTGADTELDRTVLDAIKDPLTHMVRNSADHGLEPTAERVAAGKPEKGTIRLNAYHEGGHVIICIEDDGGGINTERVLQKAITQGLVNESDADSLSEYEIHQYIFRAGFSTAEQVSSVSGRGVGMDVVRTEIERIGGTVDLLSQRGRGTTVRIKIPLTLAIISALVVESGGQSFAIPQLGIVELVRVQAEERHRIERVHDKQVFRLRNRLLPLVHLSETLQVESGLTDESDINIVIVQVGEEQMGLIVDRVFDTEEIVVKPVGRLLKDISIYQGTTILGDGRVIMILDVSGIAAEFGSLSTSGGEHDQADGERGAEDGQTSLLVFDAGDQTTMAVPLSLVSRLEEFPQKDIEFSSNGPVVQYRGHLLPLQSVSPSGATSQRDPQPIIVFSDGRQSMGLMVDAIQDVVQEHLSIQVQSQRTGVLGTAVINGKATEVIDTQHYMIRTDPQWFRKSHAQNYRVMVVNESPFFRQLLTTSLQSQQCLVTAVDSTEDALSALEKPNAYDALILDFDQVETTAQDLIDWIRQQKNIADLPVIGLASHLDSEMQQVAQQAGCALLLEKLDMGSLNNELDRICRSRTKKRGVSA